MSSSKRRNRELIHATLRNDVATMRDLLTEGASPNTRDTEHQETPLMLCRNEQAAKVLLDAGADVEARDSRGRTPFLATGLAILLERGADINAQDEEGTTALMQAVQSADLEQVEFLVKAGADLGLRDSSGQTAREIAESYGLRAIANYLQSVRSPQ